MRAEVVSNPAYSPGDVIGNKYRLIRPLGEGGMGSVWLAENTVLEVDVAIKLLRHDLSTPAADQRFLREARAAARLGHPSICRVFDFGTTQRGQPYIVMELLRGESLAERMEREVRLSAVEAVRLLLPVIDALAAAHGKRIVHRDLKPENILLSQDESGRIEPKIVDFGIAKIEERLPAPRLTQAGTVLGSPEYMSPEQAAGLDDIDARSDVWSVCVVLYEAISGCVPFGGPNYNAVLRAILQDEPRPILDFAAGDSRLWEILRHGLSKDRAQRIPSIRELGAALAQWLFDNGVTVDIRNASLRASWIDLEPEPQKVTISSLPPGSGERPSSSRVAGTLPHLDALKLPEPNTLEPRVLPPSAAPAPRRRRAVVLLAAALGGLGLALGLWQLSLPRSNGRAPAEGTASAAMPEPASALPARTKPLTPALRAATASEASAAAPSASNKPAVATSASSKPAREVLLPRDRRDARAKPAVKRDTTKSTATKPGATKPEAPKPDATSAPAPPQQAMPRDDFGF